MDEMTVLVVALVSIAVAAIVAATFLGVFDSTRAVAYPDMASTRTWDGETRWYVSDIAPSSTTSIAVGYDRSSRQYSFLGSVSATGMAALQASFPERGYVPTQSLAPVVARLKGIDPYPRDPSASVDLRYARVRKGSIDYAAVDTDGQRFWVVRVIPVQTDR